MRQVQLERRCPLKFLTAFAVIGNALMEDDSPDTWAVRIKVPSFEQDDGPLLVAFMHTDEPQCAM
jgi:hypothetical protein